MRFVFEPRQLAQLSWLVLLAAFTCATVTGQSENPSKPSVEILEIKWEKQAHLPRNFDPSVIPTNGIFTTMESSTAVPGSTQAPAGDEARRAAVNRSAALAPVDYFPNAPSRIPVFYMYSLTIKNTGDKAIQGVAWDFVFLDSRSGAVVGDHRFLSYATIKNGQTVTLKATQHSRPITVVQAAVKSPNDDKVANTLQRAVIQCVLYADGSTWKYPLARDGVCESLKNNKPIQKQNPSEQAPKQ